HQLSFNCTAFTAICTLSLHDALPILVLYSLLAVSVLRGPRPVPRQKVRRNFAKLEKSIKPIKIIDYNRSEKVPSHFRKARSLIRSEEHTSELQSRENLVCRLLLEKKK